MRTGFMSRRVVAATVVAVGLLVGACGGDGERESAPGASAGPGDSVPSETAPPEIGVAVPDVTVCCDVEGDENDLDLDVDVDELLGERTALEDITFPGPKGTGPEIALRFLRSLQHSDHVGAARELTYVGRSYFAGNGQATLDRFMRDVAGNAQLAATGPCTSSQRLNREAAVVSCGQRKVVVHVLDDIGAGVQISKWHPPGDVYPGRHTHAFTTYEL